MPLSVLVAPSGFKEALSVKGVADAIAAGVIRAMPDAQVVKAPLADGGEGFVEAIVDAKGGAIHPCRVTGPLGDPVEGFFGLLADGAGTAVIEIAAAAGLSLVPRDRRDPTRTTSYGVGELIRAALDAGARRILVGCGDSGVNDAGAGMVEALGGRLLARDGRPIGRGGGALSNLARIDLSALDPRLRRAPIEVAVNQHNVLLGPSGVARVFGPQKGASPEQVALLEAGLVRFAECVRAARGIDVSTGRGTGASGGLGAAFQGLLGARLRPRDEIVLSAVDLDGALGRADLVITAEGALDGQTPFGKMPAEVGRRARARGVPVVALAGTLGLGSDGALEHGIDAFTSILRQPCSLDEAIADTPDLLVRAAEAVVRVVAIGMNLPGRSGSRELPGRGGLRLADGRPASVPLEHTADTIRRLPHA